jgi:hypothetical protein
MGSICNTGIKATIHGVVTLNITQKSKVQTNNFSPENHMYCVLGQEEDVICRYFTSW